MKLLYNPFKFELYKRNLNSDPVNLFPFLRVKLSRKITSMSSQRLETQWKVFIMAQPSDLN
jgi:hypothetical protein